MVTDIDGSEPLEFNLYIGGGMGRTQRVDSTFPRLVEPLGHISTDDILYDAKPIVVTQRENRKRDDRKYSRMEYLIDSWGIDKFRSEVDKYYGKTFKPFCQLPSWEFKSYLGWHEHGDVGLFCGLHVDSDRMKGHMRRTLREVTEKNNIGICLTHSQNINLVVQAGLLEPKYVDPFKLVAMSCSAAPLFQLAITEANGKTSSAYLVKGIYEVMGLRSGLLSHVACYVNGDSILGLLNEATDGALVLKVGDDVIQLYKHGPFKVDEVIYLEENSGSSSFEVEETDVGVCRAPNYYFSFNSLF